MCVCFPLIGKNAFAYHLFSAFNRQWLENSEKLKEEIVQVSMENVSFFLLFVGREKRKTGGRDTSCGLTHGLGAGRAQNYPTPFTTMVAYETTPEKKREEEKEEEKGGEGAKEGWSRAAKVGALAVGGAFIVGAAIYAFGDIDATVNGLQGIQSAA